jgi:signal transduction histidine kinase
MTLQASNLYFASPHPWSAAIRSFSEISFMALVIQVEDAEDAFAKLRFASAKNQDSNEQMAVAQRLKSVFSRCVVIDATPAFLNIIDRKTLHAATILIRKQFSELSVAKGLEFLKGLLTGSSLVDVLLSNSLRLPKMRLSVHARSGQSKHLQILITVSIDSSMDSPVVGSKTLHALMDSTAEMLVGVSLEGKINYMNRGMIDIFGGFYLERGSEISDILDPDSSVKLTQVTTMISMSNECWYGFISFAHPTTGALIPVHCRISLVRELIDQRVIGYVIACRRDVMSLNHELAASRNLDLQDQNARYALVGKIAADMIHDANGALAVINQKSENAVVSVQKGLATGDLTSTKDGIIREIKKITMMGRRIQKIVDVIDGLAHEGGLEQKLSVDLAEILGEVGDLAEHFAKNLGVSIEIEKPQQTIKVPMQPLRISQVLTNLLINACEAVATASLKQVKLSIVCDEEWIYLFVTDSGLGLPPEIRVRLFEPNFTTKKQGVRPGVGLCLSKQIAREHGGDLYFDDSSEQTRFVLELPLMTDAPSEDQDDWEEI